MHITIDQIAAHDGREVTLKGWIYQKTGKGKLQFIRLRDGSGIV
jgi:asparaginyl-tRNA synthetase